MLPDNIYVPIGVFAAAIVTSSMAYSAMISSKESKVSEFRQNWINELRQEIATYMACIRSLISNRRTQNYNKSLSDVQVPDALIAEGDLYNAKAISKASILLRVNDKEKTPEHKTVNDAFLNSLYLTDQLFEDYRHNEALEEIQNLLTHAKLMLKQEWNRARDGEKRYQSAMSFSEWAIAAGATILMALVMTISYVSLFRATEQLSPTSTHEIVREPFENGDGVSGKAKAPTPPPASPR